MTILSGTTVLASGTTNASGQFSASLANGSYTLRIAPNNARFSTPSDQTITVSGVTAHSTVLGPASGYRCLPGCVLPIKFSLNYTDSAYSVSGTLHYGQANQVGSPTSLGKWTIYNGTSNYYEFVHYPGDANCSAWSSIGIWIELNTTANLVIDYTGDMFNCPGSGSLLPFSATPSSSSCPPAAVSFIFTFPANSSCEVYPSGTTITITE